MASSELAVKATTLVKKQKTLKVKSTPAPKKKSAPSHPSFGEMITDAISSLKERTGSSQFAIAKFIEEKHSKSLPPTFKKLLLNRLKTLVADDKLVKVKNSFKLPAARPSEKPKPKAKLASAKPKPKAIAEKPKPKASAAASKTKPKPKPKSKTAVAKPKAKAGSSALKPKRKILKKSSTPSKAKKVVPVKKPKSVKKSPAKKKAKK